MNNLYLYNKNVVQPQMLLKFPDSKHLVKTVFGIHRVRMYMYMLDITQNYYMFLYNICILMRLLFNKRLYIKKVNKYYTLNKVHLEAAVFGKSLYVFLDIFGNFLVDSFEMYNMGLSVEKFDMFGNYVFEFNYCDPIFMTKNTVIVWSPSNKIRFIFYFHSKNKEQNSLYMRYLNLKFRSLKK